MLLLYYRKILTRTVATEPHFLFTSLLHGHGITGKKVMFSCEAPTFPVIMLLSASFVCFSYYESLCWHCLCLRFEGMVEKERLVNLFPLRDVPETCLK